jgi:7,8-dihydro-6-hydroxymethylpterin dimethyltransferase
LGIIDVTNRCNLKCPVCFANAAAAGYVYEPTAGQILAMLTALRSLRPLPAPAVQLSGGEPTLRADLPDLIAMAKRAGFQNIEVNTNGIRLAESPGYVRTLMKAGLDTVYLQFDGLTPDVHTFLRGRDLTAVKRAAIESCRRAGLRSVVLVVTLIKGVNDGQLGDIVRFAADNFDVVRCVNVQPLSFAGRVPGTDLERMRLTVSDVMARVEAQTGGQILARDFYPVPCEVPIARAVGALSKERYPEFTAHPHCGAAAYFFPRKGRLAAINRDIPVDKVLAELGRVADMAARGRRTRATLRLVASLRHIKLGWMRRFLWPLLRKGSFEALAEIHYHLVLLSCMHFMDAYNFDGERVRRCVIHYATPDGRTIPFCAYNNLGYRQEIERAYGRAPASNPEPGPC